MDSAASDSDVLIHLAKLSLLGLLKDQFDHVFITPTVFDETVTQELVARKEDAKILEKFLVTPFVHVINSKQRLIEQVIKKYNLHPGEASVLALGKERGITYCLTNEARVRSVAKKEGFKVVGTHGLLIRSYSTGKMSKEDLLQILQSIQTRAVEFRIHPKVLNKIKDEIK